MPPTCVSVFAIGTEARRSAVDLVERLSDARQQLAEPDSTRRGCRPRSTGRHGRPDRQNERPPFNSLNDSTSERAPRRAKSALYPRKRRTHACSQRFRQAPAERSRLASGRKAAEREANDPLRRPRHRGRRARGWARPTRQRRRFRPRRRSPRDRAGPAAPGASTPAKAQVEMFGRRGAARTVDPDAGDRRQHAGLEGVAQRAERAAFAGCSATASSSATRQADDAGDVLGAGAQAELLAAAVDERRQRRALANVEQPDALGAVEFVRRERVSRSTPSAATSSGSRPRRLDRVGMKERRRARARWRPGRATGATVPISLFASMIEASTVSGRSAARSARRSTRPARVDRQDA